MCFWIFVHFSKTLADFLKKNIVKIWIFFQDYNFFGKKQSYLGYLVG